MKLVTLAKCKELFHDIHGTLVIGEEPAIGLALYGYALARFSSGVVPPRPVVRAGAAIPAGRRHRAARFMSGEVFRVTIANAGVAIACAADQTILRAALVAGMDYPYACASGNCGLCVSHLDAGEVELLPRNDAALTAAQAASGQTLACRALPRSDVAITWLGRGRR